MDIVSIRFKGNRKCYHFRSGGIRLNPGDAVIASTDKGIDLGHVRYSPNAPKNIEGLKIILRKATQSDLQRAKENEEFELKTRLAAQEEAKELKLDMQFLVCTYSLDRKRATLYFTAEGRVDFRELVRRLAKKLHVRVELWQIGQRDETRLFGGIGPCNREFCCSAFLSNRESVTVKDAKTQKLDINPQKITGMCGKLMCCLKFEVEEYKAKLEVLPEEGETVRVGDVFGVVINVNPFMGTMQISFGENKEIATHEAKDVHRKIDNEWTPCVPEDSDLFVKKCEKCKPSQYSFALDSFNEPSESQIQTDEPIEKKHYEQNRTKRDFSQNKHAATNEKKSVGSPFPEPNDASNSSQASKPPFPKPSAKPPFPAPNTKSPFPEPNPNAKSWIKDKDKKGHGKRFEGSRDSNKSTIDSKSEHESKTDQNKKRGKWHSNNPNRNQKTGQHSGKTDNTNREHQTGRNPNEHQKSKKLKDINKYLSGKRKHIDKREDNKGSSQS